MINSADKGKTPTHSFLDVYYSNKNEKSLVASYNKYAMFKYSIWLLTEQKSVTDALVGIHLVILLKHIRKGIMNARAVY